MLNVKNCGNLMEHFVHQMFEQSKFVEKFKFVKRIKS